MAQLIVLRLHPSKPTSAGTFNGLLNGLKITAVDITLTPSGKLDERAIGTAEFKSTYPSGTQNRIIRHEIKDLFNQPTGSFYAVATAVIHVPASLATSEYGTSDIRLTLTWGSQTIVEKRLHYNTVVNGSVGSHTPQTYAALPVSAYIALPDPASSGLFQLAADGQPPKFGDLKTAVHAVLQQNPGPNPLSDNAFWQQLRQLDIDACRHLAREIIWNFTQHPLPQPPQTQFQPNQDPFGEMYTGAAKDMTDPGEQARQQHEGELMAYYAQLDTESDRLAGFIFALAAAASAAETLKQASKGAFTFPVNLTPPANNANLPEATAVLTNLSGKLTVPIAYLYALGMRLPTAVSAADRLNLATTAAADQLHNQLTAASNDGLIPTDPITIPQAIFRLRAYGLGQQAADGCDSTHAALNQVATLLNGWLALKETTLSDLATAANANVNTRRGHLQLLLCVITRGDTDLISKIIAMPVADAAALAKVTTAQWHAFFKANPTLLPAFLPGSTLTDRIDAFIRHVARYFDVTAAVSPPATPQPTTIPQLPRSLADPLARFAASYNGLAATPFAFGSSWDETAVSAAIAATFPNDPAAQAWLNQALRTIQALYTLTTFAATDELHFSLMEALYARGFTSAADISALTAAEFQDALTGSIAYDHAATIYANAGGNTSPSDSDTTFHPVNDGSLVNCIPPEHLSPLGPVAYLHDLLRLTTQSTCEEPFPANAATLGDLLADRRGPLGNLAVTAANLDVPLPLIDLVNECLEAIVANLPAAAGAVYDTAVATLATHSLTDHDPTTLLTALPAHSTPATPVAKAAAYDTLAADFSAPALPYSQPHDISRTYLRHLRTSRYATQRRFRRDITELVLDPTLEPTDFQRHLWRYPVRIDTAIEYLHITPSEYDLLYTQDIASAPGGSQLILWEIYGFSAEMEAGRPWSRTILILIEFLRRTGLAYCDFIDLWRSGYIPFHRAGADPDFPDFPDCEPYCLDTIEIDFPDGQNPAQSLAQLAIFIRLWQKLQTLPLASYTFTELADICTVLGLFQANGSINPDFIRQLAAFQMLRDDWRLALVDGTAVPATATAADRTHLLALWVGPAAAKWDWAIDELLDQVQQHAIARYSCACRPPEFLKLLAANLDPLSKLAGFNPGSSDSWHAHPTHTLRFAEILTKIYASTFAIGEILHLFTTDPHLDGDDPFPLQPDNEALDNPLSLPDDTSPHNLAALRQKLLAATVADADTWTWPRLTAALHTDFGLPLPTGPDPLRALAAHLFPQVLNDTGSPATTAEQQYRVPLATTAPLLWNTPPDGPFRYDTAVQELWTQLPLDETAVLAKISRIRQLSPAEQQAVRDLLYAPRAELAPLAFIFPDFDTAVSHLIAEPDPNQRWAQFQHAFALCHTRCQIIADHLADHVTAVTHQPAADPAAAWLLLTHLHADENAAATSWESDSGQPPAVTWQPRPNGGAFAALLGLMGTGLPGTFTPQDGSPLWRELRGPLTAFSPATNATNAPAPLLIPAPDLTFTFDQEALARVRNGFALANRDGELLGGAQGFTVTWDGVLLIEQAGAYQFFAGTPTDDGEKPDFDDDTNARWRVMLAQGQKTWVLLSHNWPDETAPAACASPLTLKAGAYQLTIDFAQPDIGFDGPEDLCPQTTGFQLKYQGPDSGDMLTAVPRRHLFHTHKDTTLAAGLAETFTGAAQQALAERYPATLRDMRRTYQRAFKALLFAHRLRLSAAPAADDGQSELGYLLAHPEPFRGTTYYRKGSGFALHRAWFDLNLLPVGDNYRSPSAGQDRRSSPTAKRQQALFDWWERLFDYTVVRQQSQTAPERPLWFLWHEAAENHPDDPAHLLRHLGADFRHADLLLRYHPATAVTSSDLIDDRWTVRLWHAETWLRHIERHFTVRDIRAMRPDLWASPQPAVILPGETVSGNANLTQFVRDGCIENGPPRRYVDIQTLNDGLRERGRAALLAYLTTMSRVALPWGGFATTPRDLSDRLLLDVTTGLCQQASRIESAISSVHLFMQRARLGLEIGVAIPPALAALWDTDYATFQQWQSCRRRHLYRENWVEWDERALASRSEAYRFLEQELQRKTLTMPAPGGLTYWPAPPLPPHAPLTLLQSREPSWLTLFPSIEGLGLQGMPERHARPSWLAALGHYSRPNDDGEDDGEGDNDTGIAVSGNASSTSGTSDAPTPGTSDNPGPNASGGTSDGPAFGAGGDGRLLLLTGEWRKLPMWIQAAIRLGVPFRRVAAAGIPPASAPFAPRTTAAPDVCCAECGETHAPVMDEYYFWLLDGRTYHAITQNADWGVNAQKESSDWHNDKLLPTRLHWPDDGLVYLLWCRVHNGEFQQPRRSFAGVQIATAKPEPLFQGRSGDSLFFTISGGVTPTGYPDTPAPGFRYDIETDTAVPLPELIPSPTPQTAVGDLPAYPFFAYFAPGAPLVPVRPFSPAVAVAAALRTYCHYEAALKWYECVYTPLAGDNRWCAPANAITLTDDGTDEDPDNPGLIGAGVPDGEIPLLVGTAGGPCCDTTINITAAVARQRAIILHWLETAAAWGDALLRRNTPEAFQQARLLFDTANRVLGTMPLTVLGQDDGAAGTIATFNPHAAPLNPRLLALYETTADRLALIHTCQNAARLPNGRAPQALPYFGYGRLRDGWQETADYCADADDWCQPDSPYRFLFLVQKAQELAADVRGLGAALLAAYEKGDAEYLASLRATHERQLLNLTREIRQNQWRDADWQVQGLEKSKEIAQARHQYYTLLIQNGLNSGEIEYETLTGVAITSRSAGNISEAVAQSIGVVPDWFMGIAGIGGTPLMYHQMPVGTKLAGVFATAARIANSIGEIANTTAALRLTQASWQRRLAEWQHQKQVLAIEIEQIERQILGAERRRDVALRELNNLQLQLEHSGEVHDWLRDKLTNHALYLWLQQETAVLHHQLYRLAHHTGRQAQVAFNRERGHTAVTFLPNPAWDTLHEGLLAGERLQTALRQMEKAFLDANTREYELTKHLSLRVHFPLAFLKLLATGSCEIDLPEWLFDMDYPGHYMRRIKNVTLTIPAVVGPYTGVHCRLTLLSATTRVDPRLINPPHGCCDDPLADGYAARPDDPRLAKQHIATAAIATSTGQNDSGMFEVNFRDERMLPFEYAGAISRWRLELPPENNYFDLAALSDVVMRLDYMAREGGDLLRQAAQAAARNQLPGAGLRLFDIAQDMPEAWYHFKQTSAGNTPSSLEVVLQRHHFPFLPGNPQLDIRELSIFIEQSDVQASDYLTVAYLPGASRRTPAGELDRCHPETVRCTATAGWPGLYHGILSLPENAGDGSDHLLAGLLRFLDSQAAITRVILVCGYHAAESTLLNQT